MDEIIDELADMGYMKPMNEEFEEWKRRKRIEAIEKEEQIKQDLSSARNGDKDSEVKDTEDFDMSLSPDDMEELKEFEKKCAEEKEFKTIIQSNKTIRSLWKLLESLGENYEWSNELHEQIEDIGIYSVDAPTITLQEAVNYSRHRKNSEDQEKRSLKKEERETVVSFLTYTYNMSEVCAIFHKLNYPSDYQWFNEDEYLTVFSQKRITVGCHESDYTEVDLRDVETWPLYNADNIDIDVECEVNFQNLLLELKSKLGGVMKTKAFIDLGLRIPYSQFSRASSYEIRLIDYLRQLNYVPRVTVCISRSDAHVTERACFDLTYVEMSIYKDY